MTTEKKIDRRIFDLYDEYCHGRMNRREFLDKSAAIMIGGVSALWMAQALLPRYAEAQTISFTDPRIKGTYVEYPSPGGTSGEMRGYLVQPTGAGPFPAVLVIHENRGLNPHIEEWRVVPRQPDSSHWHRTGCLRLVATPEMMMTGASCSAAWFQTSWTRT
ncbi:MAG: hypothetical protein CM1200mP36_07530 [Gammaproteobacteria bacterium]|nr:MAG: hypothetical protein CM1200mP36_07530 [Gammaproteobacteria bacterium]